MGWDTMPRNMSFSMTTPQFIDGSKDVTRRFGWWNAKAGDIYNAVEKAMGLKKGEKIKSLGLIRVVSARKEPLSNLLHDGYGDNEVRREGYPFGCKTGKEFAEILAKKSGYVLDSYCMRIEFERVENEKKGT